MFSSLTSAVITGGNFTHINTTQHSDPFDRLWKATAPNAFHNSGERRDPPKCHHNTRVAILEKILQWILGCDPRTTHTPIMWIYGPAGAGKSAIAQSISDACHDDQLLLASFFFSRFDSSRNHAGSLIPTMAYQIAECLSEETKSRIVDHVNRDPLIFTRSIETQMMSLIVKPLQPLINSGYFQEPQKCRRVIIIDGLDECVGREREVQLEILHVIQKMLRKHNIPLLFCIFSRPEHDLMGAFRSEPLHTLTTMIPLDDGYQSYQDIELFLQDKFAEVKATHPFRSRIPPLWPGKDNIQHLALKSSGQFIYAATVIKFVKSTRHHPSDRLDIILGLKPAHQDMPFSELDAVYTHIFSNLANPKPALEILAFYILSATRYMDHVGHMEAVLSMKPGETELILCDLSSVLRVTEHPDTKDRTIHIFHASLEDFLLDKSRSGSFWVDAPARHAEVAQMYIRYFTSVSRMTTNNPTTTSSTCYPVSGLFDLGAHIQKASPTTALKKAITSFSKDVLAHAHAATLQESSASHSDLADLGLRRPPNRQFQTNDILDFLKAIKNSRFDGADKLYKSLRSKVGIVTEEPTYEQSIRAPFQELRG